MTSEELEDLLNQLFDDPNIKQHASFFKKNFLIINTKSIPGLLLALESKFNEKNVIFLGTVFIFNILFLKYIL